jgi:hypothetical protein
MNVDAGTEIAWKETGSIVESSYANAASLHPDAAMTVTSVLI